MSAADELQLLIARVRAGGCSPADLDALREAVLGGRLTVATGERSVALGGDAQGAVIVTGDHNIVIPPFAAELLEALRQTGPQSVSAERAEITSGAGMGSQRHQRTKPDIEVVLANALIGGGGRVSPPVIMLIARNHDNRRVVLNSFGIDIPEIGHFLTGAPGFGGFQSADHFPHVLVPGRKCQVWIAASDIAHAAAEKGQQGMVHLIGFYSDELDNTYKSPPQEFDVAAHSG